MADKAPLSGSQFGSTQVVVNQPAEQPRMDGSDHPLPLSAHTGTSAGRYQIWRKPKGPLPYSAATKGSYFDPS